MAGKRAVPWLIGLFVLGAALATRTGTHGSSAAVSSTLHGTVGPGFDISLTYDDGTPVASPPAGSYRIVVNDLTSDHNFHLIGPGVDMSTGTEQIGSATWNVTFQNNSQYIFQCDTHPAEMNGIFTIGSVKAPPPGSTTTSTGPIHTTPTSAPLSLLTGSVGSSTAKLVVGGKRVSSLKAGKYRVTITDSSAKAGFKLQRIGFAATSLTSAPFVGKHAVTVNLATGKWKYFSSARGERSQLHRDRGEVAFADRLRPDRPGVHRRPLSRTERTAGKRQPSPTTNGSTAAEEPVRIPAFVIRGFQAVLVTS